MATRDSCSGSQIVRTYDFVVVITTSDTKEHRWKMYPLKITCMHPLGLHQTLQPSKDSYTLEVDWEKENHFTLIHLIVILKISTSY